MVKHNILKRLWCFHGFYKIKPETEDNTVMMSLIGDAWTKSLSWSKLLISLDLKFFGNIWDIAIVNKILNIVLVVFGYFNPKILHIVPLTFNYSRFVLVLF